MVKLMDAVKPKGGNYFSIGDVVGKDVLVTEDMTPEYEIRQTEDQKYFCLQISLAGEVKDLHLASGALKALVGVMPKNESWKGHSFCVTAITGKGYTTKTHIHHIQKGADMTPAVQARLPDLDMTKLVFPAVQAPGVSILEDAVAVLRKYKAGVHDSRIIALLQEELRQPDEAYVRFIFGSLKAGERIKLDEKEMLWTVRS